MARTSFLLALALLACVLANGVVARSFKGNNRGDDDDNDSGKLRGDRVRVMTYNIFHGVGQDNKLDLPRTASAIRQQRVDIVGLQEVDRFYSSRSNYTDQPKELAKLLGWNYVYAANLNLSRLADTPAGIPSRQYGTAILTRFKILSSYNTFLSKFLPTAEQRGLAQAKLLVDGEPLWFFNTHLSAAGFRNGENGTAERTKQVLEVIDIVKSVTVGGCKRGGKGDDDDRNCGKCKKEQDTPFVLLGDFNAKPNDTETAPLFKVFQDNWVAANGPEGGFTIPVENPNRRIDYIFSSPKKVFKAEKAYVPQDSLTKITSDHLPVVAQLKLKDD